MYKELVVIKLDNCSGSVFLRKHSSCGPVIYDLVHIDITQTLLMCQTRSKIAFDVTNV